MIFHELANGIGTVQVCDPQQCCRHNAEGTIIRITAAGLPKNPIINLIA